MSGDTPEVCAAIIRKYADLREEYLKGNNDFNGAGTIDSDRWLMCEIQGLRKAADLISSPTAHLASIGLPSQHWGAWHETVRGIRETSKPPRESL